MDTAISGGDEGGSGSGVGSLPGGTFDTEKAQIEMLQASGPTCVTFVITNEDHTIGNTLRYILSKHPDVDSCGYAMPHPSDPKLHIRIQTKVHIGVPTMLILVQNGRLASEVLQEALNSLTQIAVHVGSTFEASLTKYRATHPPEKEK